MLCPQSKVPMISKLLDSVISPDEHAIFCSLSHHPIPMLNSFSLALSGVIFHLNSVIFLSHVGICVLVKNSLACLWMMLIYLLAMAAFIYLDMLVISSLALPLI